MLQFKEFVNFALEAKLKLRCAQNNNKNGRISDRARDDKSHVATWKNKHEQKSRENID